MSQQPPPGGAGPARPGPGASAPVLGFTPLPTGARVGELVVQSVLGAGEFGITYLTEHQKRSKRYVLKEYFPRALAVREGPRVRPRQPQHQEAYIWGLKRFLSEARALEKLRHPALVEILGVIEHGGTGYAGMAFEQGRDFGIWLHEHKRIAPQEELEKILTPLLDGLELAHANKVYHLDLVPDCIVIRENGTPVFVDFGVFRVGLRRRLPPGDLAIQSYSAPELLSAKGGPVGPWTDIYALAGLLYLSIAGRAPLSVSERARGEMLEPAAEVGKGRYRPELLAGIDAGLQLMPNKRPASIGDWRRQLLRARTSPLARLLPGTFRRSPSSRAAVDAADVLSPVPSGLGSRSQTDGTSSPDAANGAEVSADSIPRVMIRGTIGMMLGALAGALAGYGLALALRSQCSGEDCLISLVTPLALLGAAMGLLEGARAGRARRDAPALQRDYEI